VTSTKTTFNSEALSGALVKFYNYGFILQLFQAKQREHRAQREQANQLQQTQLEDVQQQLRKANQQLDQAVTDNEKLNDDVLAKTQQVKQYKKQVDGLKAEVATKHEVSYVYTIISIQMCWHGKRVLLEVGIRLQCYWTHCTVHSTFGVLSCSVLELQPQGTNNIHFNS